MAGVTVGTGNFALHLEGVGRGTDDYRVPERFEDGHVAGSFNDTSTLSLGGSWIGDSGYFGAAVTRQRNRYGLPGYSHEYQNCHPHGSVLHCGGHGHDHDHEEEGDHGLPFIKLKSERVDVRGEYLGQTGTASFESSASGLRHAECDCRV